MHVGTHRGMSGRRVIPPSLRTPCYVLRRYKGTGRWTVRQGFFAEVLPGDRVGVKFASDNRIVAIARGLVRDSRGAADVLADAMNGAGVQTHG